MPVRGRPGGLFGFSAIDLPLVFVQQKPQSKGCPSTTLSGGPPPRASSGRIWKDGLRLSNPQTPPLHHPPGGPPPPASSGRIGRRLMVGAQLKPLRVVPLAVGCAGRRRHGSESHDASDGFERRRAARPAGRPCAALRRRSPLLRKAGLRLGTSGGGAENSDSIHFSAKPPRRKYALSLISGATRAPPPPFGWSPSPANAGEDFRAA
jgi:hypothetical protein